jgi:hypothetical protein
MHHPTGAINRVSEGQQDYEDDKKFPRRFLHALGQPNGDKHLRQVMYAHLSRLF